MVRGGAGAGRGARHPRRHPGRSGAARRDVINGTGPAAAAPSERDMEVDFGEFLLPAPRARAEPRRGRCRARRLRQRAAAKNTFRLGRSDSEPDSSSSIRVFTLKLRPGRTETAGEDPMVATRSCGVGAVTGVRFCATLCIHAERRWGATRGGTLGLGGPGGDLSILLLAWARPMWYRCGIVQRRWRRFLCGRVVLVPG